MELFPFDPQHILSFLLTLVRISLIVFLLPFFGGSTLPKTVKAALCLVLTLGLWPALSFSGAELPASPWNLLIIVLGELVLGLVLGLVVRIVFAAVQTAGHIIGFQMGFAMMNVVDPMTGATVTLTSQLLYLVSLLLFLSLNGHLYLLRGLTQSFELVPPGSLLLVPAVTDKVLAFSSQIFVLGIKIAAPVMAAEIMVTLSLGVVAKIAPQVNVLFVGFPLKIAIGFLFLGLLFMLLSEYLQEFIGRMGWIFHDIMQSAVPPANLL